MKKIIIAIVLLIGLAWVALPWLGLSSDLSANLRVATAMGAKLGCSGRYLSRLDEAQMTADLASYSPFFGWVDLANDDDRREVTATLFGMEKTRARYRDGLGCTLTIGDALLVDELQPGELPAPSQAPWPQGQTVETIDDAVQGKLEAILAQDNEAGYQSRAMLVVHQGRVVAEAYAPGFDSESPLLGWSMGKSLTAIMIGHLVYLGQLSAAEADLFPEWAKDERSNVTVEDLLHMASGLDFAEVYAPGSDATHMLFSAPSASAVALASDLGHEPGSHFSYSSGTTNLLVRLLTTRLGGPQAALDYLQERIFAPLGMHHSTLEPDPSGLFVGSSYIYAPARDWARLGQLMLDQGELNGQRLLSPEWVKQSASPNNSSNDPRYGYQFWLNRGGDALRWPQLPEDAYAMMGNRQQSVVIVPSAEAVLVRLGWSSGGYPMADNFAELLETL